MRDDECLDNNASSAGNVGENTARAGSGVQRSTITAQRNYSRVMSDTDTPGADKDETLAEFFAATMHPMTESSSFTPNDVAELIRRDRDASE